MGADLYYKVPKNQANKYNAFVERLPESLRMMKANQGTVSVFGAEDIKWARSDECNQQEYFIEYFKKHKGTNHWKASGINEDDVKKEYASEDELFDDVAAVFKKCIEVGFDVKIYSKSCALSGDYFTPEQIRIMTNDGKNLSSTPKEESLKILKIMRGLN